MITRKELESIARSVGFNSYQAEKDYLQHALLATLYEVSTNEFVFKGGTALQKVFGLDRFSEDLDFTYLSDKDPMEFIEKTTDKLEILGIFAEMNATKIERKNDSFTVRIKIKGPLYDGSEKSIQTITIELSLREEPIKTPIAKRIVPIYPDLRPYVVLCMDLDEMLAEKIRAIMTRGKPRDVYDLWFMLKKNAKFNEEYVNKKLLFYGKKFRYTEFNKQIKKNKDKWWDELSLLIRNPPTFVEIYKEIKNIMKIRLK